MRNREDNLEEKSLLGQLHKDEWLLRYWIDGIWLGDGEPPKEVEDERTR